MLWTPENDFNYIVTNIGNTYTNTGIGSQITTGSAAHAKGSVSTMLAGAAVAEDILGISIGFSGGDVSTAVRTYLADLMIDPAGGTDWSVLINNLVSNGPSLVLGGYWYYFPLYIRAGSSIGMRLQCNVATQTLRGIVRLYGRPTHPELVKVGSYVRTFGALTGTTLGTAVTFGTSTTGTFTSFGNTSDDLWWWQAGMAINDTSQTAVGYLFDVLAGDANNKVVCGEGFRHYSGGTVEASGKDAMGFRPPFKRVASGSTLYVRGQCSGTPDTATTVVVYGVGG